jgi:hypothetical protein
MFIYWLEQMLTQNFKNACRWNNTTQDIQHCYWQNFHYDKTSYHSSYPVACMEKNNDYTEF